MSKERLKHFLDVARKNNLFTNKVVDKSTYFSNAWVTFIAPVLIGFGVNYFFTLPNGQSVPIFMWLMTIAFGVVHLFASYVLHQNSNKFSLYSEAIDLQEDISSLRNELAKYKWAFRELDQLRSTQISVLRMAAHATDSAVGHFDSEIQNGAPQAEIDDEKIWDQITLHLQTILYPLIFERETLFKYVSESKYNIALYFYDEEQDRLSIVHRDCDSRLSQRNRDWRPGIGHVGLAFLHKATKICSDITKSSELMSNPLNGDAENYKSFLSMPILKCDDDADVDNGIKPLGVLVLTSALPEQFNEQRDVPFMTMIIKLLAIYLSSVDNYITRFNYVDSNAVSDTNDAGEKQ